MSTPDRVPMISYYRDEGCPDGLLPSCLSCPLPACRAELPPKMAGRLVRQVQIAALMREGLTVAETAARMGVSRRTVIRARVAMARGEV